jgi:hypothetical protein
MQSSTALRVIALLMAPACAARGQQPSIDSRNDSLPNVAAAFDNIPTDGTLLEFAKGSFDFPRGGHLQGIQMRYDDVKKRHLVFLSHDSQTVAYLVIVEFPADMTRQGRIIHLHTFPSDGRSPPLRHAGGIQLCGDILAVGLEDNQLKTRSEVQFWNVSAPEKPLQLAHLTIPRSGTPKDKTAGGVALVQRKSEHLVAVANWDSRAIDFYKSNEKPLDDTQCRFEQSVRWSDAEADKTAWRPDTTFAPYQAINFVAQDGGMPCLLGFATSQAGANEVDLFAVNLEEKPRAALQKLANKVVSLRSENRFQFAGGCSIRDGSMAILSSPGQIGPQTAINILK